MTTDQQRLSAIQAELLPCPFCGGEAILRAADNVRYSCACRVSCRPCGVDITYSGSDLDSSDLTARCIKAWNTRTQLSTPKTDEPTHFAENAKCLSRDGGEFDEAGAWADAANKWPTFSKHLIENYRDSYITGWGHCARIAHAELTEARKRIAELEAALEWQPIETAPRDASNIIVEVKGSGGGDSVLVLAHFAHGGGEDQPHFGPGFFYWGGYGFSEILPPPKRWSPANMEARKSVRPIAEEKTDG